MMFALLLFVFAFLGMALLGVFVNMVEGREVFWNFLMTIVLVIVETIIFSILFLGGYSI